MSTTTTAPAPARPADAAQDADELAGLVFAGAYRRVHEDIRNLLLDPVFDPRPGLTADEAGHLAYERSRRVHGRLERPRALVADPERLFALAEWPSLLDVSVFSLLMVHYNLCFGTVLDHGGDRPDLAELVDELDDLTSFGPYMATELGYGNNVAALRTEAVYDPDTETFVLNTPDAAAQKYMSYSGFPDVPKVAVVMARLREGGRDHGVFPFLVRISENGRLSGGIHAAPCPEKPVQGLDNGVTWFDGVRVPRRALLSGAMGGFGPDGAFEPAVRNQRTQFLRAMSRIQPGRLCVSSSAVGAGRAAVYIALRYSANRMTNAPGRGEAAVIEYRSHQLPLFTALAKVYAMTALLNRAKREYLAEPRGAQTPAALGTLIALTKAVATWEMADVIAVCRERCGAQGMFSVNRIADYGSLLQGLVTAEGDNLVLLSTAAAQLVARGADEPEPAAVDPRDGPGSVESCIRLLHHREWATRRTAADAADSDGTYFESWNRSSNAALESARLRAARLALESLAAWIGELAGEAAREALGSVALMYGLTQVAKDAGWYALHGLMSVEHADGLPARIDELCERIKPHAPLLVEAFQLSPELLRAPIAADDYIGAFQAAVGGRTDAARVNS
jgi:acyl-CoA oxidase